MSTLEFFGAAVGLLKVCSEGSEGSKGRVGKENEKGRGEEEKAKGDVWKKRKEEGREGRSGGRREGKRSRGTMIDKALIH